jgi:glycosyltransferase involved in cell wall biosynthesis
MKSIKNTRVGLNGVALLSPLTGIGQYTYHLVQELQQILAIQPWLFYGTGWRQELRSTPLPGVGGVKKMFKRFVPNSYKVSRFLQDRQFGPGMKKRGIELYHEPNFIAHPCDRPTVVTVHDLSWVRHPETHPIERVEMMNSLMPNVIKNAQHLLVDSDFVRNEVISYYGVSPDLVTTVLLGVSPSFKPVDALTCQPTLTRHGLRYGEYILVVGTLEPRKNLATVIAAFQQLPPSLRSRYPLVIVGMNGWRMEKFSTDLQQLISAGEVKLAGYVTQQDLPMVYAGARLFVYPSIYEGFGLPPLEAMACGVPVIVSRRASLPEVVGEAGILVEAMDSQSIANRMREVLEDPILHAKLSVAGRVRSERFSWRQCALETARVYQQVLAAS